MWRPLANDRSVCWTLHSLGCKLEVYEIVRLSIFFIFTFFIFTLQPLRVAALTLDEFIAKEEGIELGKCVLSPKPQISGESIYVVIPARFENPNVWATHSVLLVGVDMEKVVQADLELKVPDEIYPRDVLAAECKSNNLTINISGAKNPKSLNYIWDGKALKRPSAKSSGRPKK